MDKISLASYMIQLKNRQTKKYLPFDNYESQITIYGEKIVKDFFMDLVDFLNNNKEFTDRPMRKDLGIEHVYDEDRFCYGTAFYGTFGKYRQAKNVKTKEINEMDVDTATEEPFYYLFYLPNNSDRGIAIFERKGNISIKDTFKRFIEKKLIIKDIKGFSLDYSGYLPKKVVLNYIDKGEILSFEFSNIPSHTKYEENRINHYFKKVRGKVKIKLQVDEYSKPSAKQVFYKLIKGEMPIEKNKNDFITIDEINAENSRVEVKIGRYKRWFYIDGNSIRPFMDITKDIKTYESGHPKFEDIHEIALEYAKNLFNEIGAI
ncbi:hypothetical protein FGU46_03240 [Methanobacterium sp. CWC-01]|uniref:hypothetical protein n=1 Tax=Methanobacterium aridiramus TaxID=2584467 RepID=UPI002577491B|nr:hypothetical protein [Methanobacterium sp. CWC-01]WJI09174.1 hypothetical protein FGU46_03240 [Methanobacterium sp. CWC-01]